MTTFALYKSFFGSAPRIGEAKAKQFGFFGQRSSPNQIKPPRCGLASLAKPNQCVAESFAPPNRIAVCYLYF